MEYQTDLSEIQELDESTYKEDMSLQDQNLLSEIGMDSYLDIDINANQNIKQSIVSTMESEIDNFEKILYEQNGEINCL